MGNLSQQWFEKKSEGIKKIIIIIIKKKKSGHIHSMITK